MLLERRERGEAELGSSKGWIQLFTLPKGPGGLGELIRQDRDQALEAMGGGVIGMGGGQFAAKFQGPAKVVRVEGAKDLRHERVGHRRVGFANRLLDRGFHQFFRRRQFFEQPVDGGVLTVCDRNGDGRQSEN